VPIGVAVGVVSAISFVGDGNLGPGGKTDDTLDEGVVDGEGGVITEGDVDNDLGLKRDSPESLCNDVNVPIDDSNPKPPSDSVERLRISRRKDEFRL
jgi:hypothetical protein